MGYYYPSSEYLATVFTNTRALWVANMVTHYRHNHIKYYDNSVDYASSTGRYDELKHKVNERAKRNIIRKGKKVLLAHGITAADFDELQGTTDETRALAMKVLGGGDTTRDVRVVVHDGQLLLESYGVI